MFGGSSSSGGGGFFGGGESSSASATESILPTFQDEPACASCCPQLSFKQRYYCDQGHVNILGYDLLFCSELLGM